MGPIGVQEMIGLFMIALLLFGPKKLPELGRTLGKALTEFRRAKNELTRTFESHMNELEKETREEPVKEFKPTTYAYPYDEYGRYEEPAPQLAEAEKPVVHTYEAPAPSPTVPPAVMGTIARSNGVHPIRTTDEEPRS